MDHRVTLTRFASMTAALALLGVAGACALAPPSAASEGAVTSAPVARVVPTEGARRPFPEVCGDADDVLVCARVPLALPGGVSLGEGVRELAAVERDVPGSEVKLVARTSRRWIELPVVLGRTPPAGGEAVLARLVDAHAEGATLVVRVRTALRVVPGDDAPARDLEENAFVCTLEDQAGQAPACTRLRTATAPDVQAADPFASARWRTERAVRVEAGGRVVIAPEGTSTSR